MYFFAGRLGVVAVSDQIFAIGGVDGSSNLSTVEVYSIERQCWSSGPPMRYHCGGISVALTSC